MAETEDYLNLVSRLSTEEVNRSENDLSARLTRVLESFGLQTVFDTGGGSDRQRRPDILGYADRGAADLVVAADVVVESKKPAELQSFSELSTALCSEELWTEKFLPYVRAHSERISLFILTTFERFLAVPISQSLRLGIAQDQARQNQELKSSAIAGAVEFDLRNRKSAKAWSRWCATHLTPETLRPQRYRRF